jgi:hypothetical protein
MMIKLEPPSARQYGNTIPMDRLTRSFLDARDDLLRLTAARAPLPSGNPRSNIKASEPR